MSEKPVSFLGTPATAPGPLGPQMLRSFGAIRSDPLGYLDRTWREFGDVVQFPIPRPPSYLVNEPAAVRRVLVDNARGYGKGTLQYRALSLVTGEGLLTADGERWRRQRRLVQPSFHHEAIARVADHVQQAADRLLDRWVPDAGVIDADQDLMEAALEVVGHALFGEDLAGDADALTAATLDALEVVVARARVPLAPPPWVPSPANRRLKRANAILDRTAHAMVERRRGRPAGADADMLDLLLATVEEGGDRLTEAEIRDEIVTFIVAGHETVASALAWAVALLADRPDWQDRIAAEALEHGTSAASFPELRTTRAVVDEVLRLLPPAWLITRQALADDELDGHAIPAGALIIMSPALLHRHPAAWDDAEAFRPERFLEGRIDRTAFIPFGAGPRLCIGRDFAYLEAVLMLARIAERVRWVRPVGAAAPEPEPLVTIRPAGGVLIEVSAR